MTENILVLGGGNSPERAVSMRSSKAVADAAIAAGYQVTQADPAQGFAIFDGITKETIILPILHGAGGEDGEIQSEMEKRGLSFLGADSKSSENCFDKWKTRQMLAAAGLPLAKGELVNELQYQEHPLKSQPHVLKTPKGGSSIGTVIIRDPAVVDETSVKQIFEMGAEALIEELIEGTETTVPILDDIALMPIEIIPPSGDEFDYENKYNGRTQELCPPDNIPEQIQKLCQKIAEDVHMTMRCRHLSRVDIMLDKQNQPFVLEINTMPGLTDQSLFPKSAALAGMDMPRLVTEFIELVKRDYNLK